MLLTAFNGLFNFVFVSSHLWTKLHQLGDSKLLKQVHLMACRTRGQPLHSRMAVIMRNCIPQLGLQAATYKNMPYQSGLGSLNVNITWRQEPVNMEQPANTIILSTSVDRNLTVPWALWVFHFGLWVDLIHPPVIIQETYMVSPLNIVRIVFHPWLPVCIYCQQFDWQVSFNHTLFFVPIHMHFVLPIEAWWSLEHIHLLACLETPKFCAIKLKLLHLCEILLKPAEFWIYQFWNWWATAHL
jgi:hypothetical protein